MVDNGGQARTSTQQRAILLQADFQAEPMNTDVAQRITQLGSRLGLGVVAVIGAGLSLSARYPTSAGLTALLWNAIDADPTSAASSRP